MEKAPKKYWDELWKSNNLARPVNIKGKYIDRKLHIFFKRVLQEYKGKSILEIGCANSMWLPYFAKEFNMKVTGIDYSLAGCEKALTILNNAGVEGEVIKADLFNPPPDLLGQFDVVISFGVIEHFTETDKCIRACSLFLRDNGLMITEIPNMAGYMGYLQKNIDPMIYDIHVPLDKEALEIEHQKAGLKVCECNYFIFLNLSVINTLSLKQKSYLLWIILIMSQKLLSNIFNIMSELLPLLKYNKKTSPYIICVAKKIN